MHIYTFYPWKKCDHIYSQVQPNKDQETMEHDTQHNPNI